MRILIYGAGVIGSLYGALLAEAGYDVSVYARGRRLKNLTRDGLQYKYKGKIKTAPIKVLSTIEPDDRYDFIEEVDAVHRQSKKETEKRV